MQHTTWMGAPCTTAWCTVHYRVVHRALPRGAPCTTGLVHCALLVHQAPLAWYTVHYWCINHHWPGALCTTVHRASMAWCTVHHWPAALHQWPAALCTPGRLHCALLVHQALLVYRAPLAGCTMHYLCIEHCWCTVHHWPGAISSEKPASNAQTRTQANICSNNTDKDTNNTKTFITSHGLAMHCLAC